MEVAIMKTYVVKCEVDMRPDEIREVIVVSHRYCNAINKAIRQLKEDGYFDIHPISCSEIQ